MFRSTAGRHDLLVFGEDLKVAIEIIPFIHVHFQYDEFHNFHGWFNLLKPMV